MPGPLVDPDLFIYASDALVLRGDLSMVGSTLMLREERNGELVNLFHLIRRWFDSKSVCIVVIPIPKPSPERSH